MNSTPANRKLFRLSWIACVVMYACLSASVLFVGQEPATKANPPAPASSAGGARGFDTPQQAAAALVDAAEKFDEPEIERIFGPDGYDIVLTGELPQDRQRAADFAAEAREKQRVALDPKNGNRAFIGCTLDDYVVVLDLHTFKVTDHIQAGGQPDGLAWAVRH